MGKRWRRALMSLTPPVRPANQLDRNVNPTESVSYVGEPPASLQGQTAPPFKLNGSEFWVQGVNVGFGIRF